MKKYTDWYKEFILSHEDEAERQMRLDDIDLKQSWYLIDFLEQIQICHETNDAIPEEEANKFIVVRIDR